MWSAFKIAFQKIMSRCEEVCFGQDLAKACLINQIDYQTKEIQLANGQKATIHLAKQSEYGVIYEIEKQAYQGKSPWGKHLFYKDLYQNQRAIYLIVEQQKKQIAFLGARLTDQRDIHISNLSVLPSYRYLGCAKALIAQLIQIAQILDKKELTLEVRQSNSNAIGLYTQIGFKQTGIKVGYYQPEEEDAIEMSFKLPQAKMILNQKELYSFKRLLPLKSQDLAEEIYQLVQENYTKASNWTLQGFEADLKEASNYYYGVYYQKKLIGFVSYQVVLDEATITNIVIQKQFQKQGLAQLLWQLSSYDLREMGIVVIFLEVRESNQAARNFYEASGFELYHRRKDYYHAPLEDALLYRYQVENRDEEGKKDE